MSDSLQYLNAAGDTVSGDAANNFLQNKLKDNFKGRYTKEQISRLNAYGGASVVDASDGALTDGSPAYDADNPTKNGSASSGGGSGGGGGDYSHMTGDSDTERNYREGNWGKGEFDAEALAEKFGLDRSQEGKGEGHIWGTNPDGSKVYIGKSNEGLRTNEELIKAHGSQKSDNEMGHSGEDGLSSSGDVKGAILTMWKGAGGGGKQAVEKPNDPIEHSPEHKQAVERVRAYENDVLSGKMSDDIFGGQKVAGSEYAFDSNKGIAGIGTEGGVKADAPAPRATASFLNNKKTEIKKEFKIEPAKYGVN